MLPTPGTTSEICLGNYIGAATKFKICGTRNGKVTSLEVTVKPYNYEWSTGWEAGQDKIVTVKTPFYTKSFCPFDSPGNIAIFRR